MQNISYEAFALRFLYPTAAAVNVPTTAEQAAECRDVSSSPLFFSLKDEIQLFISGMV